MIHTREFPSVPLKLRELQVRLGDYFRVKEYLRSISVNSYTSGLSADDEEIADSLAVISSYRFDNVTGLAYDVFPPAD